MREKECVCECIFSVCACVIILHITTQCGPAICHSMPLTLFLPREDLNEYVRACVCVCVFIKLHITAQSGPVILVILCHSH